MSESEQRSNREKTMMQIEYSRRTEEETLPMMTAIQIAGAQVFATLDVADATRELAQALKPSEKIDSALIEKLKRLNASRTPGPWEMEKVDGYGAIVNPDLSNGDDDLDVAYGGKVIGESMGNADREFILFLANNADELISFLEHE